MRSGALLLVALGALPAQEIGTAFSITPEFEVAVERLVDLDGDGVTELLLVGAGGEVRTAGRDGTLRGALALGDPARTLFALVRMDAGKARALVVASPRGVESYPLVDGAFAAPAKSLLRRGRFTLRTGRPQASNFVQDVNGDGHPDLVLPDREACSLYLSTPAPEGDGAGGDGRRFTLASRLAVRVDADTRTGNRALSSSLESSISIPDLRTEDVNGDRRLDLVAEEGERHSFHLQREDGRYPEKPDVEVDLKIFKDTTPMATVQLGRTLAVDMTLMRTRDLSADGIPDYVIAHRRKVWVFHGSKAGPQFERPSAILKMTEDISFMVVMPLDDDAYPDLLLFRLEVPSLTTILAGLFASWDVEIEAIGYRNEGGRTFGRTPAWKSTTTLRLPSILGVIRNPEGIVDRFKSASEEFQHAVVADLDGDGSEDVLMRAEDKKALSFWMAAGAVDRDQQSREREMRAYLFEDEDRVWDVERVLRFMRDKAASRRERITRGKAADGTVALRDPARFRLDFAAGADLDGDGRAEVILRYIDLRAPARSTFDILRLKK